MYLLGKLTKDISYRWSIGYELKENIVCFVSQRQSGTEISRAESCTARVLFYKPAPAILKTTSKRPVFRQ